MKDISRPHPAPSRSIPYKKRKRSGPDSPARSTRRPNDASRPQMPRSPAGAHTLCLGEARHVRAASLAHGECCSPSKAGGNRTISHASALTHTNSDGTVRDYPPQPSALSMHADMPGPSLRLPLTSVPPSVAAAMGAGHTRKPESPLPGSVDTFLRSIELLGKPISALPQTSSPLAPLSRRISVLCTQNTNATTRTNGNGYQVNLMYKGYPFSYDLSALPDDPMGTIALLTITKSDPGPYLVVGAHYRRTGRSRAARAVIRSLLDSLDSPSDVEKGMGDAPVSPDSSGPKSIDWTKISRFKGAAMRPAMLLLAACEMDISQERPNDPECVSHASTAHDLFRAVYGTVNDAIIAGAVRPSHKITLGLDLPSDNNCSPCELPGTSDRPPRALPGEAKSLARVKNLEKELSVSLAAQKKLQEKLTTSNDRLTRAEDKVHALESRSRDVLVQLDARRDENWELRRRLAESEERAKELAEYAPSVESQFLGRLKDWWFDNLGGGVHGE